MEPYYTMVKTSDGEQLGLVQIYTPDEKQNIISYLVGSNSNGNNELKLYKFSADSNIVGPMQLDKQLEEDEAISWTKIIKCYRNKINKTNDSSSY